jgi:CTP synthase (UTP-ammonia lyase)
MRKNVTIGLIGDHSESVPAHQAIPVALQLAAETFDIAVGLPPTRTFNMLQIRKSQLPSAAY